MIFGEHQIRQLGALPVALPSRSRPPPRGLLGTGFDQYIAPIGVEHHLRRIPEDDVAGSGVEITKPPQWPRGVSAQQLNQREILVALDPHVSGHAWVAGMHERRIVGEHGRDRRRDLSTDPVPDPLDVALAANAPGDPVLDPSLTPVRHAENAMRGRCSLPSSAGTPIKAATSPQWRSRRGCWFRRIGRSAAECCSSSSQTWSSSHAVGLCSRRH